MVAQREAFGKTYLLAKDGTIEADMYQTIYHENKLEYVTPDAVLQRHVRLL
jgi:aspartate/glutamate racemase